MGRPLGRWARDEDGARTGLPFMLWCVRSYIENPEGQYYSTKSRYCNNIPHFRIREQVLDFRDGIIVWCRRLAAAFSGPRLREATLVFSFFFESRSLKF